MNPLKMMRRVGALSALLFCVTACHQENTTELHQEQQTGKEAIAILSPVKDSGVKGVVLFKELTDGVLIMADVSGLKPGEHGFHIHEFGDCSAPDAASAGGHFNPKHVNHGAPVDLPRHVGDLGNITADEQGNAHYQAVNHLMRMSGPESIIGHSVIVHESRDDYVSQPTGNAGARFACGVIVEKVEEDTNSQDYLNLEGGA